MELYPYCVSDGVWNHTKLAMDVLGYKDNYKAYFFNVSALDSISVTGAIGGSLSTSENIIPSVSIYFRNDKIDYFTFNNGEGNIDLRKYSEFEGVIAVINLKNSGVLKVVGFANGFEKEIEDSSDNIIGILKGENKIIEPYSTENNKSWNYTKNSIVGQNGYSISFFDIAFFDKITVNNTANGSSVSTSSDVIPSVSLYNGDTKLEYFHFTNSDNNEIDLSKYSTSEYKQLRAIVLGRVSNAVPTINGFRKGIDQSVKESSENLLKLDGKIDSINTIVNGANEDIFQEIVWSKGAFAIIPSTDPDGKVENYSSVQKIWNSGKIDISIYDYVVLTGLLNGSPISTQSKQYPGISIFGNGKFIKGIRIANGKNTIYLSDFKQYDKVELVLNGKSTTDDIFTSLYESSAIVYKKSLGEGTTDSPKRIVIDGDSLCGNTSGLIIKQFNSILASQGYDPIISRCMGGENIIGNLTRAGGLGIRVKSAFTIPASGTVQCDLESNWVLKTGGYAQNPYNSIPNGNTVTICGIEGILKKKEINAVGIAFYNSEKTFISSFSYAGTYDIPSSAAFYRFTINNPQTGQEHITINEEAIEITSKATLGGYIDNKGAYVNDSNFQCSEFLSLASSSGSVYIDSLATSLGYEFTRSEEGEEVKVGIGEVFMDNAFYEDREYPHIWFTGQNGGYTDEEEWADMVKAAASNFSDKYIVCSTPLVRTNENLVREAIIHFNNKYINLRAYTQGQAVYDGQKMGIIDTKYNANDYESLFWPGSDKVHQNNLLSYIWAAKMWNTLLDFGFVEGERIDTGDYYLQ